MSRLPLLLLCACDALPRVAVDGDVPGSVLAGTLLVEEGSEDAPTIVLLSREDDPMPPLGTGFPVTFLAVDGGAYSPAGATVRSAPFAFTGLEEGGWYLQGIMDLDRNFHPEVTALATATCGDRVGWHQDAAGTPQPVQTGPATLLDQVVVGPLTEVTAPDPVFTVDGPADLISGESVRIQAVDLSATFATMRIDVPGPRSQARCKAGFRFERRDADGDGEADASPLLPLLEDRFPRTLFVWLGTATDTPDGVDFDRGEVGDDVTIAAIGDPTLVGAELPPPGVALDVDQLDVRFTGIGQRVEPDGTSTILSSGDLPAGAWSLTLITRSGQLWTLPNECDDALASSRALPPPGLTSRADRRQGVWFTLSR